MRRNKRDIQRPRPLLAGRIAQVSQRLFLYQIIDFDLQGRPRPGLGDPTPGLVGWWRALAPVGRAAQDAIFGPQFGVQIAR